MFIASKSEINLLVYGQGHSLRLRRIVRKTPLLLENPDETEQCV